MDKISDLKECVEKISKDAHKFFNKNNQASGVRVRKKLQKCKKIAQEIRVMIQKSKQEQVQKRAAAAAIAAAVSAGGLLNQEISTISGAIENEFKKKETTSFDLKTKSTFSIPLYNDPNDLFFGKNSINGENREILTNLQIRRRLDSIPTWNGEK